MLYLFQSRMASRFAQIFSRPVFSQQAVIQYGIFLVCAFMSLAAQAVTLSPTDEVTSQQISPSDDNELEISASQWNYIYYKFDLTSVTTPVSSAILRIYNLPARHVGHASNPDVFVHAVVEDGWDESTPATGAQSFPGFPITEIPLDVITNSTEDSYLEFDVTSFIQGEAAGDQVASLVLRTDDDKWHPFGPAIGVIEERPELVIDDQPGGDPVALFTVDQTTGAAPLTVQFTDGSSDADGTIDSRSWNFGEGDGADPDTSTVDRTHTFENSGVFTVTLTVTDNDGGSNSFSRDISVNPAGLVSGLTGEYFDFDNDSLPFNQDLSELVFNTEPVITRIDDLINFDYGLGSPNAVIGTTTPIISDDTFSIRWTGKILPEFSEVYTFRTSSDDGVRLTVDGVVVIEAFDIKDPNDGIPHPRANSGILSLTAGQLVDIQLEYVEGPEGASVTLEWESTSRTREIVPASRLFTVSTPDDVNQPPTVTLAANPDAGTVPLDVTLIATAADDDGNIVDYVWDFDDGSSTVTESTGSIQHTYAIVGTYNPTVTVRDDGDPGKTATDSIEISVTDDGGTTASFTIDSDPPLAGEEETIDASDSVAATGSTITEYAWEISCDNGTGLQLFNGPGTSTITRNLNINGNVVSINGTAKTFTINVSPVGTICDIQLTVTDDVGRQDVFERNSVIFGIINDAPVITSSSTATVEENTTDVIALTATDAEDDNATLAFTLETGADEAKFEIDAGTLKFITAPDYENPTDTGGTDGDNVYEVNVKVTDSGGSSDTQTITVTVTNAGNEAPEITSNSGNPVEVDIAENTAATETVATVTATDPDVADSLTFTLGGTDAGEFNFTPDANGTTAVLTFKNSPDFDNPTDGGTDNIYNVIVTVSDNATPNSSDTQAVTVTVTDANDNVDPEITSNGGDPVAVNVVENTPVATSVTTVTATDADVGDSLIFALSGTDADDFDLTADPADATGKTALLTFKNVPDHDNPTDDGTNNVYEVIVTVTDDAASSGSDTQAITVTVTDAGDNIAPVITSNSGGPVAVDIAENTVITTTVATITATDADAGDSLTFTLSGTDADDFDLTLDSADASGNTALLTFKNPPDFDNPTDSDPDNIYTVIVTVADNATPNASDSQTITVTVTDAGDNEAPVANDDEYSLILINGSAFTENVLDNDVDSDAGDTLSVSSFDATTTAGGTITESNGVFTYTAPVNPPASDTFTYKASDGTAESNSATVTLTLSAQPQQIVTLNCPDTARAGSEFTCQAIYTTSDTNAATSGLGLTLFFDSAELEWQSFDNVLQTSFVQQSPTPVDEGGTNRSLISSWSDFGQTVNWPGQVPETLFTVTFKMDDAAQVGSDATISMAGNTAATYGFTGVPATITVANPFSWDVDGDGITSFTSDGILIIRYLFGFTGNTLTDNAIGATATRNAAEIKSYLDANADLLDIDADGVNAPLTDGLLIVRFLAGFSGATLIDGAINPAGNRTDAADIETYLNTFL